MTSYIPRSPGAAPEHLRPGTEIDYAGLPGDHMIPLDTEAQEAVQALRNGKRLERMREEYHAEINHPRNQGKY